VWANSPWSSSYFDLWHTPLRVELGNVPHLDHLSLQAWVNDALMTVFFLLVGVERAAARETGPLGSTTGPHDAEQVVVRGSDTEQFDMACDQGVHA